MVKKRRGLFSLRGKHFRTRRGRKKHTSERQHRFFHALIGRRDKAGDHTHYTKSRRGSRHRVKK